MHAEKALNNHTSAPSLDKIAAQALIFSRANQQVLLPDADGDAERKVESRPHQRVKPGRLGIMRDTVLTGRHLVCGHTHTFKESV